MKYFTRRLKALHHIPDFNHHPKCANMQIIQLGFADDLLLFCMGDIGSIKLLYNCFLEFSKASGLEINKKKSSIFFGGVSHDMQEDILEFLGIQKGEFPIFMLPKKITKLIEAICRSFLWTRDNNISKKALLAWEKVCQPRSAGGFNVMDIGLWNKAAISKQFCNICKEKNKLWIQWVHCYYIKNKHIWEVQLNQASWIMRKIVKAKENFEAAGYNYEDLRQMHDFSIKHIDHKLRGDFSKVSWRKLVCNNAGCPRWIFMLTLVANGRLYTKDRLLKWGIETDQRCLVCTQANESIQHLFFECQYAAELWKRMLKWQGISRNIYGWSEELKWVEN
nr:uncharacterized protein LOC104095382 [Nicotiana tomentosiformis]